MVSAAIRRAKNCDHQSAMEGRHRLRHSSDIRRVYEEGESWAHPLLVMIVRNNHVGLSRVGVTASRKVGGAVERNRAKRLMREAARHLYPQFEDDGWDLMLIARPGLADVRENEVEDALASLLRRARLQSRPLGTANESDAT